MTSSPLFIKLAHGRNYSLAVQLRFMSGLLTLLLGYRTAHDLLSGDMTGLFFPVIILASLALAHWMSRTDEDELFLHSDRIERRRTSAHVDWKDVVAIRWPVSDNHADIQLITEKGLIEKTFDIDFSAVSEPDKIALVRYLRLHGRDLDQHHWDHFCHHKATPLLNNANASESTSEGLQRPTWKERFLAWGNNLIASRPFLAGLTAPLTFGLFLLPLIISRLTAWTLASLVALSAFINLYLFWGEWLSPFTQITVCAISGLMTVGTLAIPRRPEKMQGIIKNSNVAGSVLAWLSLATLILGVPLYLNLVACNMAPEWPTTIKLLFIGFLFSPLIYIIVVHKQREKTRRVLSIASWDNSESLDLR